MMTSFPKLEDMRSRLRAVGYASLADLDCRWEDGVLVIRGHVPSYYLKQLAQERLRGLEVPIRNAITVVSTNAE